MDAGSSTGNPERSSGNRLSEMRWPFFGAALHIN